MDNSSTRSLLRSPTSGTPKVYNGVGGHAKKNKGLPLLFIDGYLLKPLQDQKKDSSSRNRGHIEADFYASVWATDHPLKQHMPAFFGVEEMGDDGVRYLCLEDLTHDMHQACVLDLKMGRRSYSDTASPEKVAKERAKYPPQEQVGFRFAGMQCFVSGELVESTREWCLGLQVGDIPDALERFFFDGRQIQRDLVRSMVTQVQAIVHCLDSRPTWRMYGASLLVCYDANKDTRASAGGGVQCRLIDFANVYEIQDEGGKDYSFLHGLYFLLSQLNIILDRGRRNLTRRGSVVDNTARVIATAPPSATHQPTAVEADPHFVPVLQLKRRGSKESLRSASPSVRAMRASPSFALPSRLSSSARLVAGGVAVVAPPPPMQLAEEEQHTTDGEEEEEEEEDVREVLAGEDLDFGCSSASPAAAVGADVPAQADNSVFQVGGAHENVFVQGGSVYKQQVDAASFQAEADFYQQLADTQDALERITPCFMGVEINPATQLPCMLLEDVSTLVSDGGASSSVVNIMDVKLGFRSYKQACSNDAKPSYYAKYVALATSLQQEAKPVPPHTPLVGNVMGKRDYLAFRDASTTSRECGFRLTALKHSEFAVSQAESKTVDTLDEFTRVMERYLRSSRGTFDSELCAGFVEELQTVLECLDDSPVFAQHEFVGTSLLFVHCDGVPVVRWIDFANVTPKKQPGATSIAQDEDDGNGVEFGCRLLMQVLETLLDQHHVGLLPLPPVI